MRVSFCAGTGEEAERNTGMALFRYGFHTADYHTIAIKFSQIEAI